MSSVCSDVLSNTTIIHNLLQFAMGRLAGPVFVDALSLITLSPLAHYQHQTPKPPDTRLQTRVIDKRGRLGMKCISEDHGSSSGYLLCVHSSEPSSALSAGATLLNKMKQ